MATSPGTPGRENEDFVAAVPGAVVLIDGAGIRGIEEICRHGIAWYARSLGGALLSRLARDDGRPLADLLAEAIEEVTDAHRDTCDVTDPSSPSATVAMLRLHGENADFGVLADSTLVLEPIGGAPHVVHDPREGAWRRSVDGLPRDEAIRVFRANRNQPDGFWVAKDDPAAASHLVGGSWLTADLDGVALLSNGASRIVDRFALTNWRGTLELLADDGPDALISLVRDAEAADGSVVPDDATAVYCSRLAY
jgi:hypothetical protein